MKFIFRDLDGNILPIDGISVAREREPEKRLIEIYARQSDGLIALSAQDRLVIRPVASNCAYVDSEP